MLSIVVKKRNFTVPLLLTGYLCLSALPISAQNPAPPPELHSANADLNGDGKPENIRITSDREKRGAFFLSINGVKFAKPFYTYDDATPGFHLVKIDRTSKARQIALHIPGPNDDGETSFYGWNGKALQNMGTVSNAEKVLGNGTVHGSVWMEFWTYKQKYVLNSKTQTLAFVRQPIYHMDVPATAKESFSLLQYHTLGSSTKAVVAAGSKIRLVSFWATTDQPASSAREDRWFLIKTAQGVSGWAKFSSFVEKVDGLPYAG